MIAPLFSLLIHWQGLFTWFLADDFAFLGLHRDVSGWQSFWKAILTPSPQSTFRPLSERAFFLLFWRLFGLNAFPYHALLFLTHVACLILTYWLVLRLTRSRVAAILAPVLWSANAAFATVLGWTCAWNQTLCALFLLGALCLWIKFADTGKWRYYALQVALFVLGFGVLELNIIYPAVAALWAISQSRRRLALLTVPLFAISFGFYLIHNRIAAPQITGPYAMHFDRAIIPTFFKYWAWAIAPPYWRHLVQTRWMVLIFSAAILVFVAHESRQRKYGPLFWLGWFALTIAPLLPLRDHLTGYYLAIPSLGIATVLAMFIARYPWALLAGALYMLAAVPATKAEQRDLFAMCRAVQHLVLGLKQAIAQHPGKAIILTGVSADMYSEAIVHRPFRVFTDTAVFLAPEMLAQHGIIDQDQPSIIHYALQPGPTLQALRERQVEVYSAAETPLRNVTRNYRATVRDTLADTPPAFVDVGNAFEAYLLGPGWYPLEGTYRWMSSSASVRIAGPTTAHGSLILSGMAVEQLTHNGPATVSIYINGEKLSVEKQIDRAGSFEKEFPLPADLAGKPFMAVQVEVNPTFSDAAHNRELSFVLGTLEVR